MDDANAGYRMLPDWAKVRAHWVARAADIPQQATFAGLGRDKASHRGIGARRSLTTLFASAVDQAYLEEIGELEALEYLWLGWPVTAKDLAPLTRLKRLRFLKLDSPRAVTDFAPLTTLPASCPSLRHLGCARFAPKPRFEELKALRPDIRCSWFDRYEI